MLHVDETSVLGGIEVNATAPDGDDVEHVVHCAGPGTYARKDPIETICQDNSTTGRFAT
jgi:hypothetical protein